MKYLLLTVIIIVVSGCGHLHSDPTPAAIDKNYPTVEMSCGTEKFNGLGACGYVEGSAPIKITVQGYYQGSVRADSERCQISETRSYDGNEEIVYEITPISSCLIDFVLSPSYPKSSGVDVSSLKGRFYIKYLKPGQIWQHVESKIPENTNEMLMIPFAEDARVLVNGCGADVDVQKTPVNGKITLKTNELGINRPDCLYEIILVSTTKVLRLTWQVWVYKSDFVPLPTPIVTIKDKKLSVVADNSVGVIALDSEYELSNTAEFKTLSGFLRIITARGRVLLAPVENGTVKKWIR